MAREAFLIGHFNLYLVPPGRSDVVTPGKENLSLTLCHYFVLLRALL